MKGAPPELQLVAEMVNQRLDDIFRAEHHEWSKVDPRLAEAVDTLGAMLTSGGKRLRAGFCFWAWQGMGGKATNDVVDVMAAFELLHAFALIHDDIMDDSSTRRGQPTIHTNESDRLVDNGWKGEPRRFGEGVAMLLGDLAHVYADRLMSSADPAARRIWDDLRIELSLGQYLDLRSAAAGDLDDTTARQVSTFKSALYTIVRPLQVGASINGPASGRLLADLEHFGRPLGRAFQLKDDLLGVLGNTEVVGKPVGDDLREGKPTELLAVALDRADADQMALLASVGDRHMDEYQVASIVQVLEDTGTIVEINRRISDLVVEAIAILPHLPFTPESIKALTAMSDYIAARNS